MTEAAMERDHERATDRFDRRLFLTFIVACLAVGLLIFGIYAANDIRERAALAEADRKAEMAEAMDRAGREVEERIAKDCDINQTFRVKDRAFSCERLVGE